MGARRDRMGKAGGAPARDSVPLPERLDIGTAGALRDDLVGRDGDVTIDASGTHLVTTPGVQVLMAFRDHQALRERTVTVLDPSRGFLSCLATLGIPLDRLQTEGASA